MTFIYTKKHMSHIKKFFIVGIISCLAACIPVFAKYIWPSLLEPNKEQVSFQHQNHMPGEIIIKFKPSKMNLKSSAGMKNMSTFASVQWMEVKDQILDSNIAVFAIDMQEDVFQKIQQLNTDPNIEHAQPNYIYKSHTYQPDDPQFGKQWWLQNTWQVILGTIGISWADIKRTQTMMVWSWNGNIMTTGTLVAIIDDGLQYDHPDLVGQLWNGSNCVSHTWSSLGWCIFGYDFFSMDKDPLPYGNDTHGTHIAWIIGAKTNNNIWIAGTNPGVKIMWLRVASGQTLTTLNAKKAIDFAKHNGAKIINASWGWWWESCAGVTDTVLYTTIQDFPWLFIAAAGNDSKEHLSWWFSIPADFNANTACWSGLDNIIAVAASTNTDTLTSFSDYGLNIQIAAPGQAILSTVYTWQYGYMDGTSMSTPFVVGVTSLARSFRPDLSYIEIKEAILHNADILVSLSWYIQSWRRLNAYTTLYALDNYPPTAPSLLTPWSGSDINTWLVSFTWTEAGDVGVGMSGYYFALATGIDFSLLITGVQIFATWYDIELLTTWTYYRRVYAFDKKYNTGDWSTVSLFSITYTPDTTPPPIPIWSIPSASSSHPRGNISFVWTPSVDTWVGTMGYVYEVLSGATTISWTTTTTWATIHLDSWEYTRKVKAYDNNLNYSDFSSPISFSVLRDTTPETVQIDSITNTEPNILYTSNIVTLTGINTGIAISVNTWAYRINGWAWNTTPNTWYQGNTIQLALTSSINFSTVKSMILTYGDKQETFTVTTRAKKTTPIGLSFTNVSNAELHTLYTSNIITITWLETWYVFTASISAGELIKNGIPVGWTSTGIENGNTLAIRLTSSSTHSASVHSTLTLGSGSATYTITTKAAPPPPWWWWGGGGWESPPIVIPTCTSIHLVCSGWVYILRSWSECQWGNLWLSCVSILDQDTHNTSNDTLPVGNIVGSPFTQELNDAYLYAYSKGITTMPTIHQANMTGTLIRKHLAKMMSNFVQQEIWRTIDTSRQCFFVDMNNEDTEMNYYAKLACQLWLMGLDTQGIPTALFTPNGEVTRAQFGTVLSRALRWNQYNGGSPYYSIHLNALKLAQIMTKIDTPQNRELRGRVMLMLMRTNQ